MDWCWKRPHGNDPCILRILKDFSQCTNTTNKNSKEHVVMIDKSHFIFFKFVNLL